MSWHFLRGQEAASWPGRSSDGAPAALLSLIPVAGPPCSPASATAYSSGSPYGTTCGRSTDAPGAATLTWYLAGSPAKPIPRQLEGRTARMTSGRKCDGSWQMSLPGTYSPRTSSGEQSTPQPTTSRRWATKPAALPFPRKTWVQTTFGPGIGYVHTPTATANFAAPSMQKWPSCRAFVRAFGRPSTMALEWLMGWPIGWTGLQPLETDKFQQWLRSHGAC
jgi:hypothetical protein